MKDLERMLKDKFVHFYPNSERRNYRLRKECIAEGSAGTIFLGTIPNIFREAAIKIIPKQKNCNVSNEAEILKRLDHPNIIKLYEVSEDFRNIYLALEYCPEGDLYNRLLEGAIMEKDCAQLFKQMVSAISYIHGQNIVHRDVKPENFLLSSISNNAIIKLVDFGIASDYYNKNVLSAKVGSSYYMAPEVLQGSYNEKCDEWSLGVVLYMMLSGNPPYIGNSEDEMLNTILNFSPSFEEEEWSLVSDSAKDLVRKLLTISPSDRISAKEALNHPWLVDVKIGSQKVYNYDPFLVKNYQGLNNFEKYVLNYLSFLSSDIEIKDQIEQFINSEHQIKQRAEHAESSPHFEDFNLSFIEFIAISVDKHIVTTQEKLHEVFNYIDRSKKGKIALLDIIEAIDRNIAHDDFIEGLESDGMDFQQFACFVENIFSK
ncbi:unnamed protein product [Blepharisma stoltei]|uniref:Protein kinase domain-containing protein n=1 Tax=Blepharisma stoltei TaxID=1481888 RepID=A0AAU9J2P4_9CILI|nr:unnamed protein product [Blepharisma stoltei]